MKTSLHRLFMAFMLLAACVSGMAETHYRPHISIGARAGATMSRASFSPSIPQTWITGSCGALTFRYTEEKLFGLVAELGWTTRGWREDFKGAPFSYSRSVTYLTLPVMTHIYFGSRRFKCFVNLGPSVSMRLGDKITADFDYRDPLQVPDFPKNRQTEQLYADITGRFDYGITAGLGFEFWVHPRHSVSLEGRFYYGLGNMFPSSKADTFGASRHMTLEMTVGYNFRLK